MRNTYQIIGWDTDFFGFLVARIIPHRLTAGELEYTLDLLKKKNVSLVYWASDPLDKESQRSAKLFHGFLADKKITYEIDLRNILNARLQKVNATIEEYFEPLPNSELEALALKSGVFSRFNTDPKFSKEQYESLYKLWILNSVNKKITDTVFVAKKKGKIVGMVTASKKSYGGHIGLIAVDENMRRKNVGADLIRMAQKWFVLQGCKIAQVVTQGDNVAGCKLYEKCGYHIKKIEHFYHFWL
ncbi:MAG: GNAT family N-acetyltransferase [Planctomycetota bacterium]